MGFTCMHVPSIHPPFVFVVTLLFFPNYLDSCVWNNFIYAFYSMDVMFFGFLYVKVLAPLPIGFAVFMVHLATIPVTGTGINPARSLGSAVIYNKDKPWDDHWIFWVGPFIGAAIAAFYHQFILRAGAIKALGSFRSNPTV